MKFTLLTAVLGSMCLAGCVAAWGGTSHISQQDENGIRIQYDPSFFSSAGASVMARQHCAKYGKVAQAEDARMPAAYVGIIEETYSCIPSKP